MALERISAILQADAELRRGRNRRAEAEARNTCDCCGEPFRRGYLWRGAGGGWGKRRLIVRIGGRYYAVCSQRCSDRLAWWAQTGRGGVPRLVGRETVEHVLQEA